MLCSHSPINESSGYLNNTVYLAVMLQASSHITQVNYSQKVHIPSHEGLKNFITSIFNHIHNILGLFDGSANLPFIPSEESVIISNKLVYTSCPTSF